MTLKCSYDIYAESNCYSYKLLLWFTIGTEQEISKPLIEHTTEADKHYYSEEFSRSKKATKYRILTVKILCL